MSRVEELNSRPAGTEEPWQNQEFSKELIAAGSLLGALGAISCCVVPFVLFVLGISGAWMSNLTALEPYQPYFVGGTLILLSIGFYLVYRKPKPVHCEGGYCATPLSDRIARIGLWTATVLVALALAWPYVFPLLIGE